jgi:hypothetical protein
MADTYGDIVNEIVDESRRSMSSTIERLVLDSITHYETQRFFFNQLRDQTFSLSSSQEYYTSADNSMIPRILELDKLTLTVSSNYKPTMDHWSWNRIEDINAEATSTGQPFAYAYWGQSIRFYPVPNTGYEARLSGLLQLPSLSASTDTNAWTQRGNGKELIKQHAKSLLYSEYLRDDTNAARAATREAQALDRLVARTTQLHATGDIEPCL